MTVVSGPLLMDIDSGEVDRRVGESLEPCGNIMDPNACPWELRDDWSCLLDRYLDAAGGGHRREAEFAYPYGINPAHWN